MRIYKIASLLLLTIVLSIGCGGGTTQDTTSSASGDFVLVTEFNGDSVVKINPSSDQVIDRAIVGSAPQSIAADQVQRLAYVAVRDEDKIVAIKADTMETADLSISGLGKQPIGVTLTPDGLTLLITTYGSDGIISSDDRLDVVSLNPTTWPPTSSLITSISTGKHPVVAIVDHSGRYAEVTVRNEPAILIIDLSTYKVVWSIPDLPAGAEPEGGDAHPTENIVYVTLHGTMSTLEVIDLDNMNVSHVFINSLSNGPAQPSTVRFTPDGLWAYVSGQSVNKLLVFDTSDPLNPIQDTGMDLSVGAQPHFIVWLPGERAYVANTNNTESYGSLSIIENYAGIPNISGPILTDFAGPLSFAYFEAQSGSLITN